MPTPKKGAAPRPSPKPPARKPIPPLLTQNSELKKNGVWAWTLPAHWATLPDGRKFVTCPNAGVCAAACYAKAGRWRFPTVLAAHTKKLVMVLDDLPGWRAAMTAELTKKKYAGQFVRVHDGGDFFSEEYTRAWFAVAAAHPDKTFYAYTKEVALFKRLHAEGAVPANFVVIYSYGGRQDDLIDREADRNCDVFPDRASLEAAGYSDNEADDRLAATGPKKVGIVANRIPHLVRAQGGRTFRAGSGRSCRSSNCRPPRGRPKRNPPKRRATTEHFPAAGVSTPRTTRRTARLTGAQSEG